ncbi:hypothetical protein C7S16_1768 [Burkholderia thailandensis]|uniref:Uncharacterized protein n=1 Tax=Burkholderia thailandensis TaxID=57975 RepID=A0AAW9CVU5_BURTH|nr:hypothetical protein [Burkholderia thailandensis]MDW9255040.1 hypothetical protein [Burkholderia thailandensis]
MRLGGARSPEAQCRDGDQRNELVHFGSPDGGRQRSPYRQRRHLCRMRRM